MKKLIFASIMAGVLVACSDSVEVAQKAATSQPAAPETDPVMIDNTPVQALAIGGSIQVLRAATDLSDPDNILWREAGEYQMDLGLAPPVHPSINLRYDPTHKPVSVYLRVATDGNSLYLRMRWADTSHNIATGRSDFADAAAVQFSLGDAATTSFMMGATNGPVNIWYWQAGQEQAQNLAAGGFGSTTRLQPGGLSASSSYRENGEWVVVFSRPLNQTGEHEVQLDAMRASMAFALWQGEERQRDGLKHVSMGWVSLSPAETSSDEDKLSQIQQSNTEPAS